MNAWKPKKEKNKANRYDWHKLKLEFFEGPWKTLKDFREFKKMPGYVQSPYITKKMKGWSKEKESLMDKALGRATDQILEESSQDLAKVKVRQARIARWVAMKGAAALKNLEPKNVEEARKLLLTGLEQERKALGIGKRSPQSLTQVNVNLPKTRLDELLEGKSYEEILGLIAEVKRQRALRAGTAVDTASQAKA